MLCTRSRRRHVRHTRWNKCNYNQSGPISLLLGLNIFERGNNMQLWKRGHHAPQPATCATVDGHIHVILPYHQHSHDIRSSVYDLGHSEHVPSFSGSLVAACTRVYFSTNHIPSFPHKLYVLRPSIRARTPARGGWIDGFNWNRQH
jgi:hypothetical protein